MKAAKILRLIVTIFIVQLIVSSGCFAGWTKEYVKPVGPYSEQHYSMTPTGELFVTEKGHIWREPLSEVEAHGVTKIDSNGNILWSKQYHIEDPAGDLLPLVTQSIKATSDGGCIATAITRDHLTEPLAIPLYVVMKIDSDGAVEWMNRFEHSDLQYMHSNFPNPIFKQPVEADDGGYAVPIDIFRDLSSYHSVVMKFSASGELKWHKKYYLGTAPNSLKAVGLVKVTDGYILLGASYMRTGDNYSLYLTKIDNDGSIGWQKKALDGLDQNHDIRYQSTTDGGFVLTGNGKIIKFDVSGIVGEELTIEWSKVLDDGIPNIITHQDGTYTIASGWDRLNLTKLNSDGTVLWTRLFDTSPDLRREYFELAKINDSYLIATRSYTNGQYGPVLFFLDLDGSDELSECVDSTYDSAPIPLDDAFVEIYPEDAVYENTGFLPPSSPTFVSQDATVITRGVCNYADVDQDGYGSEIFGGTDCNDNDPSINPGACEIKGDGIDQDCNGYDLTIDILSADYNSKKDVFKVTANSSLGSNDSLSLEGFGPMSWDNKKDYWAITVDPAGGDPGSVPVTGTEGSTADECTVDPEPEICNDGIDNDQDGDIDCADSDCAGVVPECPAGTCSDYPDQPTREANGCDWHKKHGCREIL